MSLRRACAFSFRAIDGLRPEIIAENRHSRPEGGAWAHDGTHFYVLGPNPDERLIYIDHQNQAFYPHTDKRGSTIALSRNGAATERFSYSPFGEGGQGPTGYAFRYTGQRLDPWTGLYDYKARVYSPTLGRFLQPDPALWVDGPNLYAYVGNGPTNGVDSSGLATHKPEPEQKPDEAPDAKPSDVTEVEPVIVTASQRGNRGRAGRAWSPQQELHWQMYQRALERMLRVNPNYQTVTDPNRPPPPEQSARLNAEAARLEALVRTTPSQNPDAFIRLPGRQGYLNRQDGSLWQRDRAGERGHGGVQWKRWDSRSAWENGRSYRSYWPDGRPRGD
ncbi:RHS repeat-associated core domain-containing protein [Brevundimonas sp. 2R-24]|uniref:RHS repeat-associated core domain-containing protein n=1 Tax=Peiella sedimenti TaxID=3061083 RepID=A0ABT8SPL2_9CAUL|nr:RHS repeat-associated core domain-containing protein [Caulobacteraceae bacterium XZ-24]